MKPTKKQEEKKDWLGNLVEITNINPNKLNDEGKRNLAMDIVEKMSIKELDKFIRKYGYNKEP